MADGARTAFGAPAAFSPSKLRDVAERAGVHPGTASRALNPRTRALVSSTTAERVLQAAEELGYRVNPIARGLKTNRSATVAVLIPDLTNPLFPPIVRGIEDRLAESGYSALLANSDNDPDKERMHFETMLGRQAEGFIMATAEREHPLVEQAIATNVPIVLVNRTVESDTAFSVVGRDVIGARLAVEHLIELGHTRIAHIGGPERFSTGRTRYKGYVDALRDRGIDPDPDLVRFGDAFTEGEGARLFEELLRTGEKFTAVFCGNDLLALGCYDVIEASDLSCPWDVSIVGYNDMPFIDKLRPPLTTIRIPHYAIGVTAAELLLERIEDRDAVPRTVLVNPELIVRGSTARPHG
jgi:LacI family transcriptional regulator